MELFIFFFSFIFLFFSIIFFIFLIISFALACALLWDFSGGGESPLGVFFGGQ